MNPHPIAETSAGISVYASPPCDHGAVLLVVADERFAVPVARVLVPQEVAADMAIDLAVAGSQGAFVPN